MVICTDGIPNVGLGSLDGDEEAIISARQFYEKVLNSSFSFPPLFSRFLYLFMASRTKRYL